MQTLNIIECNTVETVADEIIKFIRTDNRISVCAIGSNTISQTISAIGIAKRVLKEEDKLLDIKPVFEKQEALAVEGDELKTSMTFRIITSPIHLTIAAFNPKSEATVRVVN